MPRKERRKFTDAERDTIRQFAALGLSHELMAGYLQLSKSHFDLLLKKDDKARKALELGKAVASAKIADTIYKRAIDGNDKLLMFWAKTQMRWRSVDRLELTGADGEPLKVNELSTEQLDAKIEKYMELMALIKENAETNQGS